MRCKIMEKVSFSQAYKGLGNPKKGFIKKISELTCRSEFTVRMWICGRQQPDALAQRVIADYLGEEDPATLFPAKNKSNGTD